MKQVNDIYTMDLLGVKRLGRPPKLGSLTNAQRQAKFRAKQKLLKADKRVLSRIPAVFRVLDQLL